MRYLAIPQVILGLAITFFSYFLADSKAHFPEHYNEPGYINARPPSSFEEFLLLGLGLAVLVCGLLQWKASIRGALIPVILSLIMVIIYTYLGIRAANYPVGEWSHIYYISYVPMTLGLIVSGTGVFQFIHGIYRISDSRKIQRSLS